MSIPSSTNPPSPSTLNPAVPRENRGCFFYGCLTVIALLILLLVGSAVTFWQGKKLVERELLVYTEEEGRYFSPTYADAGEQETARAKLAAFETALAAGQAAELVLSERDINILLEQEEALRQFRDRLRVRIAGDSIGGEVSLPLDFLPLAKFKQRYLNAAVDFKIKPVPGALPEVYFDNIAAKGQQVDEVFMDQLRRVNFTEHFKPALQEQEWVERIDKLEVRNGVLLIGVKPQ